MEQTISVKLNRQEKERLNRLALRFGLSLPEFSRKILVELEEIFPSESFKDYSKPRELKASFKRALKDLETGQVFHSL